MGKASADLPESSLSSAPASSPPGKNVPSADDLLSQLAGSEIDRLLAEADVERTPSQGGAPDSPAVAMESPKLSVERPWKSPAIDAPSPASKPGTDAPPESISSVQDEVAAELDQLFSHLNDPKPKKAQPPKPTATSAAASSEIPESTALVAPVSDDQLPKSDESGSAATDAELLAYVNGEDAGAMSDVSDDESVDEETARLVAEMGNESAEAAGIVTPHRKKRASMPIRMLMWVNAPFSGVPDTTRAALGKIAIATTINAVAVLVYVMLFRTKQ